MIWFLTITDAIRAIRVASTSGSVVDIERNIFWVNSQETSWIKGMTLNRNNEQGFTLIELLIVVAIIGILAGIAVRTYSDMKSRSFNAMAETDLRNAITAQEARFTDVNSYAACAGIVACQAALPGYLASSSDISITFLSPAADTFTASVSHLKGDVTYDYDSTTGQIIPH